MIYEGWEPMSNKIWSLRWAFMFSTTVVMAVWSKTVSDGELKLAVVSFFVEPSLMGVWFSETRVLLSIFSKWHLAMWCRLKHSPLNYVPTLNKRSNAYLSIHFAWFLCASQFCSFAIYGFYYKTNIKLLLSF